MLTWFTMLNWLLNNVFEYSSGDNVKLYRSNVRFQSSNGVKYEPAYYLCSSWSSYRFYHGIYTSCQIQKEEQFSDGKEKQE